MRAAIEGATHLVAEHLIDLSDMLRTVAGSDEAFSMQAGRSDEAKVRTREWVQRGPREQAAHVAAKEIQRQVPELRIPTRVAEARSQHAEAAGKLAAVERKIAGIMRAIEDGLYQLAMKAGLSELEGEKASLMARQDPASIVQKVSVHPNLAALYQRKVEELEGLLSDPECRDEAIETIRSMIDNITLTPRQEGPGLEALLKGDLARILVLCLAGSGQTNAPAAFGDCGDTQPA
jgi:hypothetical protein